MKNYRPSTIDHRPIISMLCSIILICLILPQAACLGAETNQISQFGITWTFDREYEYGQFANGDYWVIGPVTITGINPPSYESNGRMINGSMINPSPEMAQGYDSGIYGYDPSLNAARPNNQELNAGNPLTIQPRSSLVTTISTPDTSGRAVLQTAAILTVLGAPPSLGSFRPPYSGGDKTIKFNKNQLDYSLLKNLPITSGIRNVMPRLHQQTGDQRTVRGADSVERMFERPWLDHIPTSAGRPSHPLENMDDYDRDISVEEGIAGLMLHLDFSNEPDFNNYGSNEAYKETLLIRFIQIGIDNYGVIQDGGRDVWQQDSGRKFPILFAGLMLNDPEMSNIGEKSGDYAYTAPYGPGNPPPDLVRFEEDEMTFYVSQADVDMTHSPQWNPDHRDAEQLPYEVEDIGLPEWGKVRLYEREKINKSWGAAYRGVISPALGGFVLAVHIMGAKELWNHDAIFDYKDRFMEVEENNREHSRFIEAMWDTYREDFEPVWTRNNPSDPYSQGHYIGEVQYPVDDDDTPAPLTPPADSTFVLGDVNGDGSINIIDVTLAARHAAELVELEGDALRRANVNRDLDGSGQPKIDILDIILIARRAVGLINGF